MEKKLRVTENLLLKILADQSGLSRKEIAQALNITPQWLSTVLNSDEKLSEEIKAKAASLFKVSSDYFKKTKIDESVPIVEEPPPPEYRVGASWQDIAQMEALLKAEIERLKEEVRQAAIRIKEKEGTIEDQRDMINKLIAVLDKK